MNQIDKQPHELDRWENEGGALPAENASDDAPVGPPEKALLPLAGREVVQIKIGPTRQAAHDRFFANLMKRNRECPRESESDERSWRICSERR
jgi:hypothetical protein